MRPLPDCKLGMRNAEQGKFSERGLGVVYVGCFVAWERF